MSDRKRAAEEDPTNDEVIGPLPVNKEQPTKKKQKGCVIIIINLRII